MLGWWWWWSSCLVVGAGLSEEAVADGVVLVQLVEQRVGVLQAARPTHSSRGQSREGVRDSWPHAGPACGVVVLTRLSEAVKMTIS